MKAVALSDILEPAACNPWQLEAQPAFPSGLLQPDGSYRFGVDALLLAAFGSTALKGRAIKKPFRAAELGSGCGAALLALAALEAEANCVGLEIEPALLNASILNARNLRVADRVCFAKADLSRRRLPAELKGWLGKCALVLANPPWRLPGSGRPASFGMREKALCGPADIFIFFCAHAARLLSHHSFFCAIIPASRLADMLEALTLARLGLRVILPVASFAGRHAERLLIASQKDARHDPVLRYPLVLHEMKKDSGRVDWTSQAREFCPWLGN